MNKMASLKTIERLTIYGHGQREKKKTLALPWHLALSRDGHLSGVGGDSEGAIWLVKRLSQTTIRARQGDAADRLMANCYLIVAPREIRSVWVRGREEK